MIAFLLRLFTVLSGIIFITGFSTGLDLPAITLIYLLVAVWIVIVDFENIIWWIILFSFLFSLIYHDVSGLYFFSIITYAFLFNIIYEYIQKTANTRFFVVFSAALLLSLLFLILTRFIESNYIYSNFQELIKIIFTGVIFFVVTKFLIFKLEQIISLYTQGHNMRRHI